MVRQGSGSGRNERASDDRKVALTSKAAAGSLEPALRKRRRSALQLLRRKLRRVAEAVIPEAILGRVVPLHPPSIATARWDDEHASGAWRFLHGVRELPHYSVIIGYYNFFAGNGSVLDIGCGEGLLAERLAPFGYRHYLGVDLSAAALDRAAPRADERTKFQQAKAEEFMAPEPFDAIILNEILYYCADPAALVRRCVAALNPDGVIIVSMYRGSNSSARIWRRIDGIVPIVAETRLTSDGLTWVVKVLRPAVPRTGFISPSR
jgi:2-polyprenyl-3-methyl-5-hydroxy-6-metoxy-1,4-benzoquinol methylase